MTPRMECGDLAQVGIGIQRKAPPPCLTTTLYDVIAAIQDRLSPDDDALVIASVVHLLRAGRLTWLGKVREHLGQSRRAAMRAGPGVAPRTIEEMSWSTGQR